jgi:hypothetical protein
MVEGGCHCGAIRYELEGEPVYSALCHCTDCRRSAGAPMVGWTAFPSAALKVTQGEPKTYASSENAHRLFCANCGTGLFYYNETMLPGLVDVQCCTFDDPEAIPPQIHVQVADRVGWMKQSDQLPAFERYPSAPG